MPRRSNRIFKKIKTSNLPQKPKRQTPESARSESQHTPSPSQHQPQRQTTTPGSRSSSVARSISSSTSSQKLSTNLSLYDSSTNDLDLVNIELMSSILQRSTKCKTCDGSVRLETAKRVGVAVTIELICEKCDVLDELRNSEKVTHEIDGVNKTCDALNLALIYGFRRIGRGFQSAKIFCGLLNLPPPPSRFNDLQSVVTKACMEVGHQSMYQAAAEAVELNEGSRDIACSFDGTWQKRGHNSLNGVVSAISVDNCKVLDVAIMSKYCKCKDRIHNTHEESCAANYTGSSGGMETAGVEEIYNRSQNKYDLRYTQYLGDGDSKAFSNIKAKNPYGDDYEITKLECVGHVEKRMSGRLKKLKATSGKLSDGKPIGGKGRLTDVAIHDIQKYYGMAIRRNTSNLENMRKDIWAEYFQLISSNEDPCHQLCGDWCKYRKAQTEGKTYNHNDHFHLPRVVMEAIKPIFRDLTKKNCSLNVCMAKLKIQTKV